MVVVHTQAFKTLITHPCALILTMKRNVLVSDSSSCLVKSTCRNFPNAIAECSILWGLPDFLISKEYPSNVMQLLEGRSVLKGFNGIFYLRPNRGIVEIKCQLTSPKRKQGAIASWVSLQLCACSKLSYIVERFMARKFLFRHDHHWLKYVLERNFCTTILRGTCG